MRLAAVLVVSVVALAAVACAKFDLEQHTSKNDTVCKKDPDPGPCDEPIRMWYWNALTGRCSKFTFGGCMGNTNRFRTRDECKRTCKMSNGRRKERLRRTGDLERPRYCLLPKVPGECEDNPGFVTDFTRWHYYYDAEQDKCRMFWFWGCGGNRNKFKTRGGCERHCVRPLSRKVISRTDCVHCEPKTSVCAWHDQQNYTCECRHGYKYNALSDQCLDVNECATGNHTCDDNAKCINTEGSFSCQCHVGFVGDGQKCKRMTDRQVAMSERLIYDCSKCNQNARCIDNMCVCNEGWTGDGYQCQDVDECKQTPYPCDRNALCDNTYGSFKCECLDEFAGNGNICTNSTEVCLDVFDPSYVKPCHNGDWQPRFFFNGTTKQCEKFWYDGCPGMSRNIFADRPSCEGLCSSFIEKPRHVKREFQRAPACGEPFDTRFSQQCKEGDWQLRAFFNSSIDMCEIFWYDQCDGHSNNIFADLQTCRWMCEGSRESGTEPMKAMKNDYSKLMGPLGSSYEPKVRHEKSPSVQIQKADGFDPDNPSEYPLDLDAQDNSSSFDDRIHRDTAINIHIHLPGHEDNAAAVLETSVDNDDGQWNWRHKIKADEKKQNKMMNFGDSICLDPFDPKYTDQCGEKWFPRFYYDINTGNCMQFWWDGCKGTSRNFFTSRRECVQLCVNKEQPDEATSGDGPIAATHRDVTSYYDSGIVFGSSIPTTRPIQHDDSQITTTKSSIGKWDPLHALKSENNGQPQRPTDGDRDINLPPGVKLRPSSTTRVPQHQILELDIPDPDLVTVHPLRLEHSTLLPPAENRDEKSLFGKPEDPNACLDEFDPVLLDECDKASWHARYHYNKTAVKCQLFWWDGCYSSRTRNVFESLSHCTQLCLQNVAVQLAVRLGQSVPWPPKSEAKVIQEDYRTEFDEVSKLRKSGYLATPNPELYPTRPPDRSPPTSRFQQLHPDEPEPFTDAWYDLHKKHPHLPVDPATYDATTIGPVTTTGEDGSFPAPDHVNNLPDPPAEQAPTILVPGRYGEHLDKLGEPQPWLGPMDTEFEHPSELGLGQGKDPHHTKASLPEKTLKRITDLGKNSRPTLETDLNPHATSRQQNLEHRMEHAEERESYPHLPKFPLPNEDLDKNADFGKAGTLQHTDSEEQASHHEENSESLATTSLPTAVKPNNRVQTRTFPGNSAAEKPDEENSLATQNEISPLSKVKLDWDPLGLFSTSKTSNMKPAAKTSNTNNKNYTPISNDNINAHHSRVSTPSVKQPTTDQLQPPLKFTPSIKEASRSTIGNPTVTSELVKHSSSNKEAKESRTQLEIEENDIKLNQHLRGDSKDTITFSSANKNQERLLPPHGDVQSERLDSGQKADKNVKTTTVASNALEWDPLGILNKQKTARKGKTNANTPRTPSESTKLHSSETAPASEMIASFSSSEDKPSRLKASQKPTTESVDQTLVENGDNASSLPEEEEENNNRIPSKYSNEHEQDSNVVQISLPFGKKRQGKEHPEDKDSFPVYDTEHLLSGVSNVYELPDEATGPTSWSPNYDTVEANSNQKPTGSFHLTPIDAYDLPESITSDDDIKPGVTATNTYEKAITPKPIWDPLGIFSKKKKTETQPSLPTATDGHGSRNEELSNKNPNGLSMGPSAAGEKKTSARAEEKQAKTNSDSLNKIQHTQNPNEARNFASGSATPNRPTRKPISNIDEQKEKHKEYSQTTETSSARGKGLPTMSSPDELPLPENENRIGQSSRWFPGGRPKNTTQKSTNQNKVIPDQTLPLPAGEFEQQSGQQHRRTTTSKTNAETLPTAFPSQHQNAKPQIRPTEYEMTQDNYRGFGTVIDGLPPLPSDVDNLPLPELTAGTNNKDDSATLFHGGEPENVNRNHVIGTERNGESNEEHFPLRQTGDARQFNGRITPPGIEKRPTKNNSGFPSKVDLAHQGGTSRNDNREQPNRNDNYREYENQENYPSEPTEDEQQSNGHRTPPGRTNAEKLPEDLTAQRNFGMPQITSTEHEVTQATHSMLGMKHNGLPSLPSHVDEFLLPNLDEDNKNEAHSIRKSPGGGSKSVNRKHPVRNENHRKHEDYGIFPSGQTEDEQQFNGRGTKPSRVNSQKLPTDLPAHHGFGKPQVRPNQQEVINHGLPSLPSDVDDLTVPNKNDNHNNRAEPERLFPGGGSSSNNRKQPIKNEKHGRNENDGNFPLGQIEDEQQFNGRKIPPDRTNTGKFSTDLSTQHRFGNPQIKPTEQKLTQNIDSMFGTNKNNLPSVPSNVDDLPFPNLDKDNKNEADSNRLLPDGHRVPSSRVNSQKLPTDLPARHGSGKPEIPPTQKEVTQDMESTYGVINHGLPSLPSGVDNLPLPNQNGKHNNRAESGRLFPGGGSSSNNRKQPMKNEKHGNHENIGSFPFGQIGDDRQFNGRQTPPDRTNSEKRPTALSVERRFGNPSIRPTVQELSEDPDTRPESGLDNHDIPILPPNVDDLPLPELGDVNNRDEYGSRAESGNRKHPNANRKSEKNVQSWMLPTEQTEGEQAFSSHKPSQTRKDPSRKISDASDLDEFPPSLAARNRITDDLPYLPSNVDDLPLPTLPEKSNENDYIPTRPPWIPIDHPYEPEKPVKSTDSTFKLATIPSEKDKNGFPSELSAEAVLPDPNSVASILPAQKSNSNSDNTFDVDPTWDPLNTGYRVPQNANLGSQTTVPGSETYEQKNSVMKKGIPGVSTEKQNQETIGQLDNQEKDGKGKTAFAIYDEDGNILPHEKNSLSLPDSQRSHQEGKRGDEDTDLNNLSFISSETDPTQATSFETTTLKRQRPTARPAWDPLGMLSKNRAGQKQKQNKPKVPEKNAGSSNKTVRPKHIVSTTQSSRSTVKPEVDSGKVPIFDPLGLYAKEKARPTLPPDHRQRELESEIILAQLLGRTSTESAIDEIKTPRIHHGNGNETYKFHAVSVAPKADKSATPNWDPLKQFKKPKEKQTDADQQNTGSTEEPKNISTPHVHLTSAAPVNTEQDFTTTSTGNLNYGNLNSDRFHNRNSLNNHEQQGENRGMETATTTRETVYSSVDDKLAIKQKVDSTFSSDFNHELSGPDSSTRTSSNSGKPVETPRNPSSSEHRMTFQIKQTSTPTEHGDSMAPNLNSRLPGQTLLSSGESVTSETNFQPDYRHKTDRGADSNNRNMELDRSKDSKNRGTSGENFGPPSGVVDVQVSLPEETRDRYESRIPLEPKNNQAFEKNHHGRTGKTNHEEKFPSALAAENVAREKEIAASIETFLNPYDDISLEDLPPLPDNIDDLPALPSIEYGHLDPTKESRRTISSTYPPVQRPPQRNLSFPYPTPMAEYEHISIEDLPPLPDDVDTLPELKPLAGIHDLRPSPEKEPYEHNYSTQNTDYGSRYRPGNTDYAALVPDYYKENGIQINTDAELDNSGDRRDESLRRPTGESRSEEDSTEDWHSAKPLVHGSAAETTEPPYKEFDRDGLEWRTPPPRSTTPVVLECTGPPSVTCMETFDSFLMEQCGVGNWESKYYFNMVEKKCVEFWHDECESTSLNIYPNEEACKCLCERQVIEPYYPQSWREELPEPVKSMGLDSSYPTKYPPWASPLFESTNLLFPGLSITVKKTDESQEETDPHVSKPNYRFGGKPKLEPGELEENRKAAEEVRRSRMRLYHRQLDAQNAPRIAYIDYSPVHNPNFPSRGPTRKSFSRPPTEQSQASSNARHRDPVYEQPPRPPQVSQHDIKQSIRHRLSNNHQIPRGPDSSSLVNEQQSRKPSRPAQHGTVHRYRQATKQPFVYHQVIKTSTERQKLHEPVVDVTAYHGDPNIIPIEQAFKSRRELDSPTEADTEVSEAQAPSVKDRMKMLQTLKESTTSGPPTTPLPPYFIGATTKSPWELGGRHLIEHGTFHVGKARQEKVDRVVTSAGECYEPFDERFLDSCMGGQWQNRFYFDLDTQRCRMFWYDGCLGTSNNIFKDMESCQWMCEGAHPRPEARSCLNDFDPVYENDCRNGNYETRYRFDHDTKQCTQFHYGGCKSASRNIFSSHELCETLCERPHRDLSRACLAPFDEKYTQVCGDSSLGYQQRFYFDKDSRTCRMFWYGNCKGTSENIWSDLATCQWVCERPNNYLPPSHCLDTFDEHYRDTCGNGNWVKRYYFDHKTGTCDDFWHDGCVSESQNFFVDSKTCSWLCEKPTPAYLPPADEATKCLVGLAPGNCSHAYPAYWYDRWEGKCKPFYFTGCHGNRNRFLTLRQCDETCSSFKDVTGPQSDCLMPLNIGQNTENKDECVQSSGYRYYFNRDMGKCGRFWFHGCGGNKNNFASIGECEQICTQKPKKISLARAPDPRICFLERETGSCDSTMENRLEKIEPRTRYSYDAKAQRCSAFKYYGCGGNANRFSTREECAEACGGLEKPFEIEPCAHWPDWGPCNQLRWMWFFNMTRGTCDQFLWGGCGGNPNRYSTFDECQKACETPGLDVCSDPLDRGVWCEVMSFKYYFNKGKNKCEGFHYTGCGTSANRFDSIQECLTACVYRNTTDDAVAIRRQRAPAGGGITLGGNSAQRLAAGQYKNSEPDNQRNMTRHSILSTDKNGTRYLKSPAQFVDYNQCIGYRYNVSGPMTQLRVYLCLMDHDVQGECIEETYEDTKGEEHCRVLRPWLRDYHRYSWFFTIDKKKEYWLQSIPNSEHQESQATLLLLGINRCYDVC